MLLLIFNACLIISASVPTETDATIGNPPRIKSGHTNSRQTVRETSKLFRLTCPVEDEDSLMVEWKKDGKRIGPAWTRFKSQRLVLKIRNVMLEDAGYYTCEAVNGFGRTVVEFKLIVYDKSKPSPPPLKDGSRTSNEMDPPVWTEPDYIQKMTFKPIMKLVGTEIKLECIAHGHPRPKVQWYKDREPIIVGYHRSSNFIHHLKELSKDDTGQYTCRVYNNHGAINATFTIKVHDPGPIIEPPPVIETPLNRTVSQGQTATFQCKVTSLVPPHIKWLKKIDEHTHVEDNSTVIKANGREYIVLQYESKTIDERNNTYVNKLVIERVSPKDSGWYICVVTNPAGHMDHKSAHLNVEASQILPSFSFGDVVLVLFIAVPVGVLVLVIGCAIIFLQKHKQKASAQKNFSSLGRPPVPSYPPPALPYNKNSSMPQRYSTNGYYPSQHRYIVRAGGGEHFRTTLAADYRAHDAQASVPLNSSFADDRDLYEATPQPYEIDYEHSEVEFYPEGTGRLQPHPSLYSCR